MTPARFVSFLLSVTMLAGCAVGPDFERPGLDRGAGYLGGAGDAAASKATGIKLAYGADVPGRWWELFRNRDLDALMKQAIENNPDLDAARATLKQANELALAQGGSLFPSLSLSGSATRSDWSGSKSIGVYNLFAVTPSASYPLDIFGGTRRSVEAAQATAEAQGFVAEATYLTVTASLARAVIQEASYREQIAASQEVIASYRELLGVLENQVNVGTAARANLLQQQAALAQAQASLPALQKALALQQNTIAALVGDFPNQYASRKFRIAGLGLPHALPLSVPSALVEQRPDIRAAEARLHKASAEIGVATAAMLPQLTLSAALPTSAADLGDLFASGTTGWSIAAGLAQPIFKGGTLIHNKRASEAAFEAAVADYRSTVLGAFKDVANALRALQHDRQALAGYLAAERAAKESFDLTQTLFKAGTVPYTNVLTAQTTYQSARLARASAAASRYLDAVALFEALGGGWWNRPDNLVALANTDPQKTMTTTPASGEKN
ncbi:efflux transporter outer membrane subunit [Pleomorphomonas koreensis]|uniref:efflux transporter outer membrane subunit n=1 Tax=Pleomorphomonas koreensis TaxID=257440 RepID=UPI0003F8EB13|nr:efflux transporter outer membrane subunit [Pleomorphomonas koreensis]